MSHSNPTGHSLSICMMAIVALCASVGASATEVVYSGASYGATTIGSSNQTTTAVLQGPGSTGVTFDSLAMNSQVTLQVGAKLNSVTGIFRADGARLGFEIAPAGTLGISAAGSGKINVGTLILNGFENYGMKLGGSLKNASTVMLIDAANVDSTTPAAASIDFTEPSVPAMYTTSQLPGEDRINDNSYVITSRIQRIGNDIVYTATRANDAYVSKALAYVGGHFSNNAALKLSSIAYEGRQVGDLSTVIDRLDINDYGFGNTAANLGVQSKRLAPIANNAYVLSTLTSSDYMLSTADDRLNTLRGGIVGTSKAQHNALWVQAFSQVGKQSGFAHEAELNTYDSFNTTLMGMSLGMDAPVASGWLGAAISMAGGNIKQNDFRAGDSATTNSTQFSLYGTQEFGAAYAQMSMAWGQSDVNGSRTTAVGRTAKDEFTLRNSDVRLGLGYRVKFKDGRSVLTPFASLQSAKVKQPVHTETGAGDLSLQFEQKTYDRSRAQLGLRYSTESRMLGKPTFLSLQGSVSRDSGLNNMDIAASYTGQTTNLGFVTPAAPVDRTSFNFGATTSMAMTKSSSLQLKFDLEHRRSYNAQGVQLKGLWLF